MHKKIIYIASSIFLVVILTVFLLNANENKNEKGDYILGKEINTNQTPEIIVVHDIKRKEAESLSLDYFMKDSKRDQLMIYHVKDKALYDDLKIGERVTVRTGGYVMLSSPSQAVAKEIIRHDEVKK